MTKGEIKGLQALALAHGGSLTINPDTGLPEANFLKRALPTIAGIGVGAMTMNPMLGAAVAGGLTMATGGSLVQGLMAGVGAYGGAGMLSNLAEAGATQVAAETASQATQQAAVSSGLPQVMTAAQTTPASINAAAESMANIPLSAAQTTPASITAAAESMANLPAANPIPLGSTPTQVADLVNQGVVSPQQYQAYGETYGKALETARQSPVSNTFRGLGVGGPQGFSPTTGVTNLYDIVKRDPAQAAMTAAPLLTDMNTEERRAPGPSDSGYVSSISPNFRAYVPPQPNPYYKEQYPDYRERRFAVGGQVDDELGGDYSAMNMDQGNMQKGLFGLGYAPGGVTKLPKGDPGVYRDADPTTRNQDAFTAALTRLNSLQKRTNIKGLPVIKAEAQPLGDVQEVAKGGVMSSLGGYSDGGRMLKGPGDGMSDSIPGVIGNKQPARLADGEFVVPADVVSHLGNGSTDAGAKKLYAMMDNIRKARTGKKKQAPAVKTNKYLPA
jgi:hypothetical protein